MPTPDQVGSPFRAAGSLPLDRRFGGKITAYDQLPIHALGDHYVVEGSGTVTSLPALPMGETVFLQMAGTPTFTNSARLLCPNNQNYTATAGDLVVARSNGDGIWRLYVLAATSAVIRPTTQTFLSGSGTYTTPAGVTWIEVMCQGGGSGGTGSGGSVSNSSAAGNTTFGTSLFVANGGGAATISGSTGGSASGGYLNLSGGSSGAATGMANTSGGSGGGTPLGPGGLSGQAGGVAGNAAVANTGAGGGGASDGATANTGVGGAGGGHCRGIITSPAATYAYAAGAGTSGSAAGTGGFAGGAGAAGGIWVIEHYV
jgi:hypothetical protein